MPWNTMRPSGALLPYVIVIKKPEHGQKQNSLPSMIVPVVWSGQGAVVCCVANFHFQPTG